MWLYRILFAFDALVVLVLGYFLVDGLQYSGPTGPSALWLPVLAVPIAVLAGAWVLRAQGKRRLAALLLAVAAIPPLLFGLFFGLLLLLNPNWQ